MSIPISHSTIALSMYTLQLQVYRTLTWSKNSIYNCWFKKTGTDVNLIPTSLVIPIQNSTVRVMGFEPAVK